MNDPLAIEGVKLSLIKMFLHQDWYNITTLYTCAEALNIQVAKEDLTVLRLFHTIKYEDMDPQAHRALVARTLNVLGMQDNLLPSQV